MTRALALLVLVLAGCAAPANTGVVPRADGMFTVTRQGEGFWVSPIQLTAMASDDAQAYCSRGGKALKVVHSKEIPAGPLGRWPESEVLFRCE